MFSFIRPVATWATRHALPVVASGVVVAAVAGGGITYALTTHGSAASPAPSATAAPAAGTKSNAAKAGAATALTRALTLLAADTGQSLEAIRAQLSSGQSLATIAGPTAAATFQGDLLARLKTALDKTVAAGRITAAQESARLAKATTLLARLMAEPGTTLLQQGQRLQQFVHGHASKTTVTPLLLPSPAATP